ncbi:hypothetical protein EYC80_000570 [Monilinia laxa]|uniref:Uncharacterized protein n=1 Tax=Monilinia laxa TaxID=61186 RepID=A0A5N6KB86_MONLA|nr:hypothetical protein EYC80_000570 [Monilinia laxa]
MSPKKGTSPNQSVHSLPHTIALPLPFLSFPFLSFPFLLSYISPTLTPTKLSSPFLYLHLILTPFMLTNSPTSCLYIILFTYSQLSISRSNRVSYVYRPAIMLLD